MGMINSIMLAMALVTTTPKAPQITTCSEFVKLEKLDNLMFLHGYAIGLYTHALAQGESNPELEMFVPKRMSYGETINAVRASCMRHPDENVLTILRALALARVMAS